MTWKHFRWLKTPGTFLILLCMVVPSLASSFSGVGEQGELDNSLPIHLKSGVFDPLRATPNLPEHFSYTPAEAVAAGAYVVQLNGPVMDDWKQALVAAGARLGDYVPNYAFLAYLDAAALERVRGLPFVRWVGPYQPAYKLAPDVNYDETRSYRVTLAPWADPAATRTALTALAVEPQAYGQSFSAVLDGAQLDQVAHLADVIWIEPVYPRRTFNDVGGGTIMGGSTAWASGYTGDGVTIAVADTGLDTGVAATIHQDFSGRVTDAHISSWPVVYANYGGGCEITNPGADDGASDTESGHGTHVAGSVAGNGTRSSGQIKGLGYEATVTFQAIEQRTTLTSQCGVSGNESYMLSGIPDDVRDLLNEAYTWGARVHNNSWGGGDYGVYDQTASHFDDFVYDNPDMTVVVAAGNDGQDADADGYVDENSISSPGTAKNVISVGASDNERASGGAQITWNQGWGDDYPTNPTRDDHVSDNREELAAFSSRGPMADGRIKPDVVAPGTNILSVRSSLASESGWGSYNSYYMYMGGTSMASPLTAGAAAVVREYYVEGEGHANPSAALIKATLINSAVDVSGYGNSSEEAGQPIPNNHEGWGRVNVAAATTSDLRQFEDHTTGVSTGATETYQYQADGGQPFKVTLVWSDYAAAPLAGLTLVNNLNLRVTAPNGTTTYWGNQFSGGWSQTGGSADAVNNVENVYIQSPTAGVWKVEVIGHNVPQGPQPFALVVDGALSSEPLSVTGFQPAKAPNNALLDDAVVSGTGFKDAAGAYLMRGAATITGTASTVYTDTDTLVADFDLNGATPGWWDVQVANSVTDTATLDDALFVVDATLPDLEVSSTAAASEVEAGGSMTYTIVITNAGQVTATGVIFTDTLPDDLDFASLTPACQGGTVTLPDGFVCAVSTVSMTAGAEIVYTLVVSVAEDASGALENQVVVGSNELDGYVYDNSDQVSVQVNAGGGTIYLPFVIKSEPPPPPPGTLYAVADASLLQGYPTLNDGSDSTMWVGFDHCNNADITRGLVAFDVSSIPAGTSISQAILYLFLEGSCDIGERTHTVTAFRATSGWSESSVNWNSRPAYGEAYGSALIPSRTWGWYGFNVTDLVRGWVNGSLPNYGLMLRGPESSGNDSARLSFYTHDYAGNTYAPYLSITYTGAATVGEKASVVEKNLDPTECGPAVKDMLYFPGLSNHSTVEFFEETACSPN